MVSLGKTVVIETSSENPCIQNFAPATKQSRGSTSTPQEARDTDMSSVWAHLTKKGFSPHAAEVIMASWREGTRTQYQTYINKWKTFCVQKECSFLDPPISQAIEFLTGLFEQGLSYTSIIQLVVPCQLYYTVWITTFLSDSYHW